MALMDWLQQGIQTTKDYAQKFSNKLNDFSSSQPAQQTKQTQPQQPIQNVTLQQDDPIKREIEAMRQKAPQFHDLLTQQSQQSAIQMPSSQPQRMQAGQGMNMRLPQQPQSMPIQGMQQSTQQPIDAHQQAVQQQNTWGGGEVAASFGMKFEFPNGSYTEGTKDGTNYVTADGRKVYVANGQATTPEQQQIIQEVTGLPPEEQTITDPRKKQSPVQSPQKPTTQTTPSSAPFTAWFIDENGRVKPQAQLYTPEQLSSLDPVERARADIVEKKRLFAEQARQEAQKRGKDVSNIGDSELLDKIFEVAPEIEQFWQQEKDIVDQNKPKNLGEQFMSDEGIVGGTINSMKEQMKGGPFDNPVTSGVLDTFGMLFGGVEKIGKGLGTVATNTIGGQRKGMKTTQQGILDMAEGTMSAGFSVAAPGATTAFNIASEAPVLHYLTDAIGWAAGNGGWLVNKVPGLSNFRDSLPEEDQARFDNFMGGAILALLGVKGKGKVIKNLTSKEAISEFVGNNFDSKSLIKTFLDRILGGIEAAKPAIEGTKKLGSYGLNTLTQTTPEARQFAMDNPKLLSEVQKNDTNTNLQNQATKIEKKLTEYQDNKGTIGQAYNIIRQNPKTFSSEPIKSKVSSLLKQNDIEIGENGKLDFSNSAIGAKADRAAIQSARDEVKNKGDLDGNYGLNLRQSLDNKINYKTDVADQGQRIVKMMRKAVDEELANKLPELKGLDAQFGPAIEELQSFMRTYTKKGQINPNSVQSLLNTKNLGKSQQLDALEKAIPGIKKEFEAIKHAADIKGASERSTGASMRGIMTGGGGYAVGGPVGAFVGYMITHPNTIISFMKGIGNMSKYVTKISKGEKLNPTEATAVYDAINNAKLGKENAVLEKQRQDILSKIKAFGEQKALPAPTPPSIAPGGVPQMGRFTPTTAAPRTPAPLEVPGNVKQPGTTAVLPKKVPIGMESPALEEKVLVKQPLRTESKSLLKSFKSTNREPVKNPTEGVGSKQEHKSAIEAMQSPEYKAKMAKFNETKKQNYVTKTSNNLYHTTSRENIDSIINEGLTPGKKQRFEGVGSRDKLSFGANEKSAKYYGKDGDIMIRTKTSYKPKTLDHDLLAGGEGTYTVSEKIPAEMLEVKVGGKWIPLKEYKANKKPGSLRKELGAKPGKTIPAKKLNAAAKKGGLIGKRANLAKTLKSFH